MDSTLSLFTNDVLGVDLPKSARVLMQYMTAASDDAGLWKGHLRWKYKEADAQTFMSGTNEVRGRVGEPETRSEKASDASSPIRVGNFSFDCGPGGAGFGCVRADLFGTKIQLVNSFDANL